ncbi:hypothetical protein OROGR_000983 [Orobanche gracilis]
MFPAPVDPPPPIPLPRLFRRQRGLRREAIILDHSDHLKYIFRDLALNRSSLLPRFSKRFAMDKRDSCFFSDMSFLNGAILVIIGTSTLIMIRIFYVLYRSSKPLYRETPGPLSTLIVLGSGGHTAEMLNLLDVMQMDRFKPRYYIAAATDTMSLQKARVLEDSLMDKAGAELEESFHFLQIYRSREVGQSYVTSVGTTLMALTHALWLMVKIRPQVILCNGPGTCIPLCVIAFIFKVLGIRWSSIFYVESIARVRRLSLSGLLLYKLRLADQLFVQWPQLKSKYPRANYVGRLM